MLRHICMMSFLPQKMQLRIGITALIGQPKCIIREDISESSIHQIEERSSVMRKIIGCMILFVTILLCVGNSNELLAAENTSIAITKENFPDKGLREIIVWECDRNKDRVLSKEEIQEVKEISIGYDEEMEDYDLKGLSRLSELEKVEIEAFEVKNVKELEKLPHLQYLRIMTLDSCPVTTDKNPEIEELELDVPIKRLDLSKNKKLKSLDLENSEVKKLSICNLPKLKYVRLVKNTTKSVVIKNCPKLRTFRGNENNKMQTMSIKQLPVLKYLKIGNAKRLKKLTFSLLPQLKELSIGRNLVKKLDFKKTPNLKMLYVKRNKKITKLDLRPLKKLCNFEWQWGILRKIQFGKKKYLGLLDVNHNKLKKLDIRNMRRLSRKHVYVAGNPNIKILK